MDKRRWIIAASGIAVLLISIVVVSSLPDPDPSRNAPNGNSQTAVNTIAIKLDTVMSSFAISGRLLAKESVELFAEVGGKASYGNKAFKSGNSFSKGELLLQIDDREFRNNLKAQKAQFTSVLAQTLSDIKLDYEKEYPKWKGYLEQIDLEQKLDELPSSEDAQFKLFLSGRNILTQFYKIQEAEERLSKYTISAPFNGVLTESYLNQASLVRLGQKLGEFISDQEFELEASIEVEQLPYLKIGDSIQFKELNSTKTYPAKLIRINGKIDPATQMVKVFFALKHKDLKAGQYLEGKYQTAIHKNAMRIPATALVDNESVFLVKDGKAVLHEPEIIEANTNQAIIRDIPSGGKLIIDKKNKAFAGSAVIEMKEEK